MKTSLFLLVLAFIASTPQAHALFGHVAEERQRTIATEQKLERQQQTTTHWQMTAFVLGSGTIVALVIGAAVGSKTRRDHENL